MTRPSFKTAHACVVPAAIEMESPRVIREGASGVLLFASSPQQSMSPAGRRAQVKHPPYARTIRVAAPTDTVRAVINDFDHYASFIKRYKDGRVQLQVSAKLVGRVGDKKDVYLSVPIMKGAAKVWGVLRFDPAKVSGDDEILEGHLVKGNVERLDARWTLRKLDASTTHLSLELLIVPKIPVPHEVVTDELEFVSDVGVTGARNEAEQKAKKP